MAEATTIQLDKRIVEKLKDAKEYPRQTYNELLDRIVSVFIAVKKRDQYDKFLHEAQKERMKALWDNPKDNEVWG